MRILTFAETTPALLAGAKTVTRREWKHSYARTFTAGEMLQAWDKNPRTGKGKRVATIRLTAAPYLEWSAEAPADDFEAEGFRYMTEHDLTLFDDATPCEVWTDWHMDSRPLWVVRFELVAVLP